MREIRLIGITALIFYVAGLLTCKSCTKPCSSNTIIEKKIDTIYIPTKDSTAPHDPVLVLEGGKIPDKERPNKVDSFVSYEKLPADTSLIIQPYVDRYNTLLGVYDKLRKDYYTSRDYVDSNWFAKQKAMVFVSNTARANKITNQRIWLIDTSTNITETNTISKNRAIGYFGLRAMWQPSDTTIFLGATFKLKLKNDIIIGGGAALNTRSEILYMVEGDLPIRLGKRK